MFSGAVQSPVLSLFSSTGSEPLRLFSVHKDSSLSADSFVHLLHDEKSLPLPAPPANLISSPSIDYSVPETEFPDYTLNQTVLHIQSPTLRTTYVHSPPEAPLGAGGQICDDLWIKHPWMHIQVRNMGREWSLEVGIVDQTGRKGILRLSTFQVHLIISGLAKANRIVISLLLITHHSNQLFSQIISLPLSDPCSRSSQS
jgi:hypothetical protein